MGDERGRARQQRELLPRRPSDRVVWTSLVGGVAVGLGVGAATGHPSTGAYLGLAPAALAATAQKLNGHRLAWQKGGVERAFVGHATALSFYVVLGLLAAAAIAESVTSVNVPALWLLFAAEIVDTVVRKVLEARYA